MVANLVLCYPIWKKILFCSLKQVCFSSITDCRSLQCFTYPCWLKNGKQHFC